MLVDVEARGEFVQGFLAWYAWAKATVARRSDFFDEPDDDSLRDDILESIQVIEGQRKTLEE